MYPSKNLGSGLLVMTKLSPRRRSKTSTGSILSLLLLITLLLTVVYLLLSRWPQTLPLWVNTLLSALERGSLWFLIILILLPLAMTMALIWKTKEVILDSVFRAEP